MRRHDCHEWERTRLGSGSPGLAGEYQIPTRQEAISALVHDQGRIRDMIMQNAPNIPLDAVFTTRGDVYYNRLARDAGGALDSAGEIIVDAHLQTTVAGLYAAGCVTPANCQMIIAAGEGATAAQAINRDLFEESLREHRLPRFGLSPPNSKPPAITT